MRGRRRKSPMPAMADLFIPAARERAWLVAAARRSGRQVECYGLAVEGQPGRGSAECFDLLARVRPTRLRRLPAAGTSAACLAPVNSRSCLSMKCRPPFVTPRPGACLDSAAQATVLAKEQVPDVCRLCLLSWPYIQVAPIQELDIEVVWHTCTEYASMCDPTRRARIDISLGPVMKPGTC